MRAAIYARRSTEEHQAASLETQVGEARRFCEARGWVVDDAHVFIDSGISRSEFKHRPGLVAMLLAAERQSFNVVVTRDASRLGGDMERTALLIRDVVESGAELWYYAEGARAEADSLTARLLGIVRAFADELEREKIASRTREGLERRARAGHNVGGRIYGYDNVEVREGEQRVRVEYCVNEAQAAVIREVFRRYANDEGLRALAADLNRRAVPSPHVGRRGSGSWSPTTIFDMLRRERYRGVLVWGWRGSAYRKGTRVEIRRPASEWTRVERPDLAIVDDVLWRAVATKLAALKRATPAERAKPKPRSLLAGFARCAACNGPMHGIKTRFGAERIQVYRCGWAHDRGEAVCTMRAMRPAAEIDGALLDWLRVNVLRPEVVTAALAEAQRLWESEVMEQPSVKAPATEGLSTEIRRVEAEIARITTAIATTDAAPDALARALVEREQRARELRARLADARSVPPVASMTSTPWSYVESAARARLVELQGMLDGGFAEARAALAVLLRGPLRFTAVKAGSRGHRFRLTGEVVVPGWPGVDVRTPGAFASPTGFGTSWGKPLVLPIALFITQRVAA